MKSRFNGPKWKGICAWCGLHGDATNLFGFSMVAGHLPSFCDPYKTDCLDQWLAADGRRPWCRGEEAPTGRYQYCRHELLEVA